jgi:hypothetical protein
MVVAGEGVVRRDRLRLSAPGAITVRVQNDISASLVLGKEFFFFSFLLLQHNCLRCSQSQ